MNPIIKMLLISKSKGVALQILKNLRNTKPKKVIILDILNSGYKLSTKKVRDSTVDFLIKLLE